MSTSSSATTTRVGVAFSLSAPSVTGHTLARPCYGWRRPGRGGGMVYADGSNPSVRKDIGVRPPSPARFFLVSPAVLIGTRRTRTSASGHKLERRADATDAEHVRVAGD